MKISQRKIVEYILLGVGAVLFIYVLQFVLILVPPFVITVSPKEYKKGDTIRVTGIALSSTNNPTVVYLNDNPVAEKHVKRKNFFVLDFVLTESLGAGHLRLKRGSIFSYPHLLIEKEDGRQTLGSTDQNSKEFQLDLRYVPNTDQGFFSDGDKRITVHPREPITFELNNTQILKNVCVVRLRSNTSNINLKPYMWVNESETQFSLVFDDLYWFDYQNSSDLATTFQCVGQKEESFPLDLASSLRISRDFSSWHEVRADFASRQQGNTFVLPVQSRTQKRSILGIDLEEDQKTLNFFRSFRSFPSIDMRLSVVPIRVVNPQGLRFEKDSSRTHVPPYLEVRRDEREALDGLGSSELTVFRSLMNLYEANTKIGIIEMRSILSTLQEGLLQIDEEERDLLLKDVSLLDQDASIRYLMARILSRHGIPARTMAGAKVRSIEGEEVPRTIQYDKDLLFWLELFSADFGWLLVDSQSLLPIQSTKTAQEGTDDESIAEIVVPSDILKLYVFEELSWLKSLSQKVELPQALQFL